jgi:hypothetical protein
MAPVLGLKEPIKVGQTKPGLITPRAALVQLAGQLAQMYRTKAHNWPIQVASGAPNTI